MQFKRPKLKHEFNSKEVSAYLRACLFELNCFCRKSFDKPLIVTSILRKPEEQVEYCKKGNYKSGFQHCVGEAVDLRTWNLVMPEVFKLLDYWKDNLSLICHLKYHEKGTAPHLHLGLQNGFSKRDELWAMVKNTDGAEEWFVR